MLDALSVCQAEQFALTIGSMIIGIIVGWFIAKGRGKP